MANSNGKFSILVPRSRRLDGYADNFDTTPVAVEGFVEPQDLSDPFELEEFPLVVGEGPRQIEQDPPAWFVPAMRRAFPDDWPWQTIRNDWREVEWTLIGPSKDLRFDPATHDWYRAPEDADADTKVKLKIPPVSECDAAIEVLHNNCAYSPGQGSHGFVQNHGWVEDPRRGTILVSELFGLDEGQIAALTAFASKASLHFRIAGKNYFYPSAGIRMEFWPAAQDQAR